MYDVDTPQEENQLDVLKIHMKHLTRRFLRRFTEEDKLNQTNLPRK